MGRRGLLRDLRLVAKAEALACVMSSSMLKYRFLFCSSCLSAVTDGRHEKSVLQSLVEELDFFSSVESPEIDICSEDSEDMLLCTVIQVMVVW